MLFSIAVLLLTTLFWATKSANIQLSNADQLIDPYLFQNWPTFHDALFPAAHTFLLKWPLFLLVKFLGYSAAAFTSVTVLTVLITVGLLALIIYRIEKRPLIFGTLCLALASTLLLVPPQPYPGGLLPVNMGMLASRNLEYILYLISVGLFIRRPRLRSPTTWLSIACLSLLIASDRLFLIIGIGSGVLGLLAYALVRSWQLVSLFATWLVVSLLSGVGGGLILWLLKAHHFTQLSGQTDSGPYGTVFSLHENVLGVIYGLLGVATNLGANPSFSTTIVKDIPRQFFSGLLAPGGLAYLINILILCAGLYVSWRLTGRVLLHHKREGGQLDGAYKFSALLIWSTLAALIAFVFTNHYYAVDARYLGLVLFTIFVALATYSRQRTWKPWLIATGGLVLFISTILGLVAANHTFNKQGAALTGINQRNAQVAQAAEQHRSTLLVGDYWRVLPAKQTTNKGKLSVVPLDDCTTPRQGLTSQAWNGDLKVHAFAYLLSSNKSLTNYPTCSLKQVVAAYGRPNASVVTSGNFGKPNDMLLFYDRGINKRGPAKTPERGPATVVPIPQEELPYTSCQGPTIMNIVAHQDDDLLFMSPDLISEINAGHCVRTIYVTAGDAGNSSFYWLGREQGSEAAYTQMTGTKDLWVQRIVKLSDHQYATVAKPRGNPRATLIFLRLPDGNIKGQGFSAKHNESLARLEAGRVSALHSVDGQSTYTPDELTEAFVTFMYLFKPTEIRTQANFVSGQYPDHSDHMAVGRFVKKAYVQYENRQFENRVTIPLKFYIGYPVHDRPVNLSGGDLEAKQLAFFAYSLYDESVCQNTVICKHTAYDAYLHRQYQNPY
jgi:LmbE family N-acetylglucosaminyl deacetylase